MLLSPTQEILTELFVIRFFVIFDLRSPFSTTQKAIPLSGIAFCVTGKGSRKNYRIRGSSREPCGIDFGIRPLLFRARRRFAEGLPPAGFRQHVPLPTKKGLSEHCCFKKRYSDSLYFTKRRDAMKSVLFSYILHYPFLFAFRWGYRRISQRRCFYCFRKCFCII